LVSSNLNKLGLISSSLGSNENLKTKLQGGIATHFFDKKIRKIWENAFFIMEVATL
jgi:hypothetical protein